MKMILIGKFSDPETGFYYCNFCSNSLEQAKLCNGILMVLDTMIMEIDSDRLGYNLH